MASTAVDDCWLKPEWAHASRSTKFVRQVPCIDKSHQIIMCYGLRLANPPLHRATRILAPANSPRNNYRLVWLQTQIPTNIIFHNSFFGQPRQSDILWAEYLRVHNDILDWYLRQISMYFLFVLRISAKFFVWPPDTFRTKDDKDRHATNVPEGEKGSCAHCQIIIINSYGTEALKGHRVLWNFEVYYLIRMT